jgi:glycosyltransferase involved in cell wall biosynthesis
MQAALGAQVAGRLGEAEELYRRVLAGTPDEPDALHSLGLVCYACGDYLQARLLVLRALDFTGWRYPAFKKNLGLILGKLADAREEPPEFVARRQEYARWSLERQIPHGDGKPLVSVIVPSYNHARYIGRALKSVFAQSYRNLELIIIDDGSKDGSVEVIRSLLVECPIPHQFIARENRGSVATVLQGLELAHGAFVNILHSDDTFPPDRFALCVRRIADSGLDWGFSAVEFVDADDRVLAASDHPAAGSLMKEIEHMPLEASIGLSLLSTNVAVTTGNLFIRREFLDAIGGLRIYKYSEDWEFGLRASLTSEPVFLQEKLYRYRFHGQNTVTRAAGKMQGEAFEVMREFLGRAMDDRKWPNPFAPVPGVWGMAFYAKLLRGGLGLLLDETTLRRLADDVLA